MENISQYENVCVGARLCKVFLFGVLAAFAWAMPFALGSGTGRHKRWWLRHAFVRVCACVG